MSPSANAHSAATSGRPSSMDVGLRAHWILQLWLLTATMNAWLGGDDSIVVAERAVSAGGLALNVGLFRQLRRTDRANPQGRGEANGEHVGRW
jgi:uncharacterized protein DUF6755